jgi:hypothetical protein
VGKTDRHTIVVWPSLKSGRDELLLAVQVETHLTISENKSLIWLVNISRKSSVNINLFNISFFIPEEDVSLLQLFLVEHDGEKIEPRQIDLASWHVDEGLFLFLTHTHTHTKRP